MSWFCWYFEEASCGFTPGPEKGELGHSEGAFRNIESGCLTFYFICKGDTYEGKEPERRLDKSQCWNLFGICGNLSKG
ncbi:uncharacterized protein LOC125520285 isoform X2 [Triticum urartu]|uniref:uncharacterized protein LOC125520285 isoform X2 n=1 Tax=Triticum urartu TaxID=4572 RepID=UPI002043D81D|nr:uncharacterized protein LOC125520285 isoform X2 [Triticum urartu]